MPLPPLTRRWSKRRFTADDGVAFDAFYRAHATRILRFFAHQTLDAEAALDLTAETFALAFEHRDRLRAESEREALSWVYGIAEHQLSRFKRRAATERRALDRLGIQAPRPDDEDYRRIEELAGSHDLRSAVATGVDSLPAEQRAAVQLRLVEELPYQEVAARLDISEQAARARVSRALRALAARPDTQAATTAGGDAS
jgi:RNA polymerase sigma-70 factor, ECF subfamily